ncbi:MAG: carbohydrate kinase family protein, partial [Bosea sp. (in: a-proteobacteria)]
MAFQGQPAGSPFNVAVGLARLGCKAAFVTGISRDAFGERLITALAAEGIDSSLAPRTNRPTILSFVLVRPDGVPEYAFYGENGADTQVRENDWPTALPDDIDAIHFGGFPLAVEPSKSAYAALVHREAGRRFVSLDPNIRMKLIGDPTIFRTHLDGLVTKVDLIKASTEDIGQLYPGERPESLALDWLTRGAAIVVVTDGPNGATAYVKGMTLHVPTKIAKVIDTVGAGDSFMSALLAGLLDHGLLSRKALGTASAQ